jgi:membrane-bound ClpP family serine protease
MRQSRIYSPLILITLIGPFSTGSVLFEGELWQARSKGFIPAGRTVRVLRQDTYVLTVKETKIMMKK